jgi:hypothetical protein
MKAQLPIVNCQYGAPMGRSDYDDDKTGAPKLHLARVYIDSQGYDNGGAYWGLGQRLFVAWKHSLAGNPPKEGGNVRHFVRAKNRECAKEILRQTFSDARFYR